MLRAGELNQTVLILSIVQDPGVVKVYGHSARTTRAKTIYYPHKLSSYELDQIEGNIWEAYKFTWNSTTNF